MSPTHSQRVNIMSKVLWFRTLRMYFIPLFPTSEAWEVYQENTCAFSFCFFAVTAVIDHWQGSSAELGGLCSGSAFRSPAHRGKWPAWSHIRSSLDCCHIRRLGLSSLVHQNLPPWISNSVSTALPEVVMD